MDIISPMEIKNEKYVNSRELTKELTNLIMQQEHTVTLSEDEIKKKINNTEEANGKTEKKSQFIA